MDIILNCAIFSADETPPITKEIHEDDCKKWNC